MEIYPYKFEPIYKERIWGGRNLERLFGRRLAEGVRIGESWDLADLAEGVSVVANGPLAGTTLTELTRNLGADLLGTAAPTADGRFPLLLKMLDANDILSLQVHPDEQAVAEIGPPAALKAECWYVIESRGGMIYKGVRDGVTAEQFRAGIENNSLEQLVRRYDVAAGDFHYLPAGTVHALGAGLVVAEVQTPSDTTYRVSDWGRGRQLHIERSMQCIHFTPADDDGKTPGAEGPVLLRTKFFTVERHAMLYGGPAAPAVTGEAVAMMLLAGDGEFTFSCDSRDVRAVAGDTVLLPAGLGCCELTAPAGASYLAIRLGDGR